MLKQGVEDRSKAPSHALYLRVLVTALGEVSHPPWWRTQYLSETGMRFLERLYPRTVFAAAVRAAGVAACVAHDGSIGHGRLYHLFRLPVALEWEVQTLLLGEYGTSLTQEVRPMLGNAEELINRLHALAVEVPKEAIGPWRVGKGPDLHRLEVYKRMAGAYLQAFQGSDKIFPYVEAE
jgi:hypothetical protein